MKRWILIYVWQVQERSLLVLVLVLVNKVLVPVLVVKLGLHVPRCSYLQLQYVLLTPSSNFIKIRSKMVTLELSQSQTDTQIELRRYSP